MGKYTVEKQITTERSISFGGGKHKTYCPYHLAQVDINKNNRCLKGCQFYAGVLMGKIVCSWSKADGVFEK